MVSIMSLMSRCIIGSWRSDGVMERAVWRRTGWPMRATFRIDMEQDYKAAPPMHPHDERPYSFCPMCGGALEPRAIKQNEPERLVCVRCGFVFYLDPKVAVGTIINDGAGRIVLVKRAIE